MPPFSLQLPDSDIAGNSEPRNKGRSPLGGSREQQRLFLHRYTYGFGMLAMPHSKQRGFNRDVINPQDGHILCDRNPPVCAFTCASGEAAESQTTESTDRRQYWLRS